MHSLMHLPALKMTAGHYLLTDHCNSVCDRQKALLNGHHDCQYLDVTATS